MNHEEHEGHEEEKKRREKIQGAALGRVQIPLPSFFLRVLRVLRGLLFLLPHAAGSSMSVDEIRAQGFDDVSRRVIGHAITVHKSLGPGLLESAYEECLAYELRTDGIGFKRQVPMPITYKEVRLDCGYRIDLLVENSVVVELKASERFLPIHDAQVLTYLKLSGFKVGLLLNFNVPMLREGIRRLVL